MEVESKGWPEPDEVMDVARCRTSHLDDGAICMQVEGSIPSMPDSRHVVTVTIPRLLALCLAADICIESAIHLGHEGEGQIVDVEVADGTWMELRG